MAGTKSARRGPSSATKIRASARFPCPFKNLRARPRAGRTTHYAPKASPEGSPLWGTGGHQGLFVSNRSMICFFSFDETFGGGTAGGVIPAGPTPPTASLAPAVGVPQSPPDVAHEPLPRVLAVYNHWPP